MPSRPHVLTLSMIAVATLVASVAAHEFWIAPSAHSASVGEVFRITLNHGERLAGDTVPRDEDRIERFELLGPTTASPVQGLSGRTYSYAKASEPGPHIAVYQSTSYTNELDAERFEAYLHEEGLHAIVEERARIGESDSPGSESYVRCAKALIQIQSEPAAHDNDVDEGMVTPDRPVGLTLEIVLEGNQAERGGELLVCVLFEGQGAQGLRVVAVNANDSKDLRVATTDSAGLARFEVSRSGTWLLTTIHMTRNAASASTDWTSYWSSLELSVSDSLQTREAPHPPPTVTGDRHGQ